MTEQVLVLEVADLQDLSKLIVDFVCRHGRCHADFNMLSERFEVDPSFLREQEVASGSITILAYNLIKFLNKHNELYRFLIYVIENDVKPGEVVKQTSYDKILNRYGLTISEHQGRCILSSLYGGILEQEVTQLQSYIMQKAPQKTLTHLQNAKENFSKGKFDSVLSDCRMSLESLTKDGKFSDSLEELVDMKLIHKSDDVKMRKMDVEILRTTYGYNSTLGSHDSANKPPTDSEQALMSMLVTETCIGFLLKRLETAKKSGMSLAKWVS